MALPVSFLVPGVYLVINHYQHETAVHILYFNFLCNNNVSLTKALKAVSKRILIPRGSWVSREMPRDSPRKNIYCSSRRRTYHIDGCKTDID